ncbi:unnamed protein product [Rotaria sordida]|uniref:F-box domain-containing protein n=1 Tax=Rotaria sordida TaxID=392033 RepID=A0A815Q8L3_9BILA|nr:unnamed protein product [Rotaria sordida]CAF1472338.1 unnamed protein product [Rotaria sordida]CAF1641682.1 unnamed protein product [Rotaria sordida]CAF3976818.1 unnamed protein product [Rotaria sordida]
MSEAKKEQPDIRLSSDPIIRKSLCSNEKSINCIEDLSNEIFYEIFDYLDGYDVYNAFSNLNNSFENLLIKSSLLMKIQISSTSEFDYHYKELINLNKHHILSFHFNNELILGTIMQSSLSHLTVCLNHCSTNVGKIYSMVFKLPLLKYFKSVISDYPASDLTLPIATKGRYSSIEYLCMYHFFTLDHLPHLLSYLPPLIYLNCFDIFQSNVVVQFDILTPLMNLKHLSISVHNLTFDRFEKFLIKISSQLRLLSVKVQGINKNYLEADR